MLVWRLMSLDRLLKLVSILFIFVIACTSNQQINTADSCIIFDQKKNWYKAYKAPIAMTKDNPNSLTKFNTSSIIISSLFYLQLPPQVFFFEVPLIVFLIQKIYYLLQYHLLT